MPAGAWITIAVLAGSLTIALALLRITVVRPRDADARAQDLEQQLAELRSADQAEARARCRPLNESRAP